MVYSLINSWSRWWRMRGLAETTLVNYTSCLRMFVRDVLHGDEAALLDVDRTMLESYVERRMEKSVNAADSDVRAFRSFFGWASGDGDEMDLDPAKRLRQPKIAEPLVRVATPDEMEKLIAVCERDKLGRRDAAMIAVLYSGPRRGELCVIDMEHLDLEGGWLTIPKTKSGRPRRIPLHPTKAMAPLDRYLRLRGTDDGPLFQSRTGKRLLPNGVGQMIQRRSEQAGVEFSSHDARRMLATTWLLGTDNADGTRTPGSETGLMAVAGWSSTKLCARYARGAAETIGRGDYDRLMRG